MSSRRSAAGWRRGSGTSRSRNSFAYQEEEPEGPVGRRTPAGRYGPVASSGSRSAYFYDEEESTFSSRRPKGSDRASRTSRGGRVAARSARSVREPFFASASERRTAFSTEGIGSSVVRHIAVYDREAAAWVRAEEGLPVLINKVIRVVESLEERLRTESYNGYSGNVWEADDPISNVIKEKYQELQSRLLDLLKALEKPSGAVSEELSDGFYLLLSVMHVLLLNREIPEFCEETIANIMTAGALIGMNHGDPHVVLACTTDHLRDSETDSVLLAFQYVLYKVIDNDTDGQKLFGTAHRVLDAQMDILETRDDENIAISALNIIGAICVRHPQAFKTRFWDIMDLFFGWYVDAVPSDRVFEACVSAFGLFKEKFKQEIDWALTMAKQFTVDMEDAVVSYLNAGVDKTGATHHQAAFLALFQLFALVHHAVAERIRGTSRIPVDIETRQMVKSNMTSIFKAFNQILQASNPGFAKLAERVNRTLIVVITALGSESAIISSALILYARMQQTSTVRIHDAVKMHQPLVDSLFKLVASIIRSIGEHFSRDAAKDLLGPDSLLFAAARYQVFAPPLRSVIEALITYASPPVKEFVLRSFANDYRRTMATLAEIHKDPLRISRLMVPINRNSPVRKPASEKLFEGENTIPATDPLSKVKAQCEENTVFLLPDGMEDDTAPAVAPGLSNAETSGQIYRERAMVHLFMIQLFLLLEQPFEQEFVDGCYKTLVIDMDSTWIESFPEVVIGHIYVSKALWQKKCASLVVKELMKNSNTIVTISPIDRELIRNTLIFLDGMMVAEGCDVVLPVTMEWSSDALRTLVAFTSSLKILGIESEYMKLVMDFIALSWGRSPHDAVAAKILSDLFGTHWDVLKYIIPDRVLEQAFFIHQLSSSEMATVGEIILFSTSLQNAILSSYDPSSADKLPLNVLCPSRSDVNEWKRTIVNNIKLGSGDAYTGRILLELFIGLRDRKRSYTEIGQLVNGIGEVGLCDAIGHSEDLGFHYLINDVANSACHQRMPGILSSLENVVSFVGVLVQTYAPIVLDHSNFVHKSMLDFYVGMKDAGLDIVDDWEELKRNSVERTEDGNELEVLSPSAHKAGEKRRIYSKLGGITAQDVTAPNLSWLDTQIHFSRIFLFAEAVEKSMERMLYGSALLDSSLNDVDWTLHMKLVKDMYSTEAQITLHKTTLRTLRSHMLRIALAADDHFSVVRLGFPVLMECMQDGTISGVDVERLAVTLLWSLLRLRDTHLVRMLSFVNEASEIETAISQKCFDMAKCIVDQRYDHALLEQSQRAADGLIDEAYTEFDALEGELRADCFAKLNNWKGLSNWVDESDNIGPRAEQLSLFASITSPESSFTEETFGNTVEHIRNLLNGNKMSRLSGAEMAACLARSELQADITQEAIDSLVDVQKLETVRGIPKLCPHTCILLHSLERLKSAYVSDDMVAKFPLASSPPLNIRDLDISAQLTACRWLCGTHRVSNGSLEFEACWDPELYLSVIKFGRKTENATLVHGHLKDYFGTLSDDEDASSDSALDKFEMLSVTLSKLLLKASDTTISVRELDLVREGMKFLIDCGEVGARSKAVDVAKHVCLNSFRIAHHTPDAAGSCLVEVAKTLQCIGDLHRSTIGFSEDEAHKVYESVMDATAVIRFHMDAVYAESGFVPGMFVENPSFNGFMTPHEITSGILSEMSYMAHCIEGMYTKPAIHFGNWCYQQAYRMLTSLSKMLPEDIETSISASSPDVDLSNVTPTVISRIVQCYMDNLPIRIGRQAVRAVVDTMKSSQESIEDMTGRLASEESVPVDSVVAVFDYCRHHFTEVVEFFVQATHVYFVYLRKPKGTDYIAVVTNRLLELLTAFPDTLHGVWMEELPKHDVLVWKDFLPQLFGRLHHPNAMVGQCMTSVILALVARFPTEVVYPLVLGRMTAFDENIGGGACLPGFGSDQTGALQLAYNSICDSAKDVMGNNLDGGTAFATEIQRMSLLSEERWMHFLLSQQSTIKKQIKAAIKEALASSVGAEPDDTAQEDDSITEDIRTPYSDMDLDFGNKPTNVFSDDYPILNAGSDVYDAKKDNEELLVQSREGTPDENEIQRDDLEEEFKRPGKHYVRFQAYANQSWRSVFKLPLYQKTIEPVYRQLTALIDLSNGAPVTPAEREFVSSFRERICSALDLLYNPAVRFEFDEDFIWSPFAEILTNLEERHSGKRRGRLAVDHITALSDVLSRWTNLPVPGTENVTGEIITIAGVEKYVEILPTKTKPKKIVFRGSDGRRYTFLCKGLEDLSQDARIMQFLNISQAFLKRSLKDEKDVPRVRTYAVVPFGPRAGLIQWVGQSTSLLTLYRSHLERESFLGRQTFAINEDNFVDVPVYGQVKAKNDAGQQNLSFRVTEEELQELYESIQEMKNDTVLSEDRKSSGRSDRVEDTVDLFDKWVDSEDDFSPLEYAEAYYNTAAQKTKKELEKLQKSDEIPVRIHPNLHELYISYLVKSLRKDSSIIWDKFRLHEQNRTKNIEIGHLRNALESLMNVTPSDLLSREMWLACSSSEEHWRVSRSFAQSLAMTSMLGYVIGLGDRHPDNVLFDFHTGEVIHVDYNVSFEKGLRLNVPERVPYRLTPNLITALGQGKVTGTFRDFALKTLETLRKNQAVLSLLVASYVTDPLVDWTTDKTEALGVGPVRKRSGTDESGTDEKAELFSLKVWIRIREKLLGFDGIDGNRLDISSQVDRTISVATDLNNLARMFEGWVAWL